MPELPEVETMRRGVLPIVGSRIVRVEDPGCSRRPITIWPSFDEVARRLAKSRIESVGRAGKRVVIHTVDRLRLVLEPRMTGLVLLADPPTPDHVRLRLILSGGPARQLLFWDRRGLGQVKLYDETEFAALLGSERLGPDALEITLAELVARLGASRRAVKVALLDQKAIAGIGNLYASEILHVARVHPAKACDRLTRSEWQRVHVAIGAILQEAIRYEGSTLGDGTYRNVLNQDGGYQNHHRVYAREMDLCPTCQTGLVVRIVQAQRSTFFCRKCQVKR